MRNSWLYILLFLKCYKCHSQYGPDPWDYNKNEVSYTNSKTFDVPPDLRAPKSCVTENNAGAGMGEWFYKRLLAIILKGGKVQINEDNTIEVSLQIKFDNERWALLNEYIASDELFTESMFRRSLGYIEESIRKPSITEKIVIAWSEYIQFYLSEYKIQLTWILSIITAKVALIWLWRHMSHKHILYLIFAALYLYEVFISYKEAEKQEVENFLSAINKCKWYIWTSDCEVPPPDPLIFLKHMNPLKIAVRMFSLFISEPIIIISETMKTVVNGMTDGLWFPANVITYTMLMVIFNVMLILFLIMIIFNFILNIPFNFSFLGFFNVGIKQRNRSFVSNDNVRPDRNVESTDKISGATLDRILDVCSMALSKGGEMGRNTLQLDHTRSPTLRRSASTGRLPNIANETFTSNNKFALENGTTKNRFKRRDNGSGDA